ncbi:MAG: helix-turn-helix transcriptional regulator [Elusimicrobia bacterium]|nr:helix-turn-helix transcriptional regulator [Elusimicrobiota bacterium]
MKKEKSFFSKQFKNIMFEKGFTQRELAVKLGVGAELVSRWVNGVRKPSISSLRKISKVFNVPISYFIENEISDKSNKNSTEMKIKFSFLEEKIRRVEIENSLLKKEIELIKIKLSKKK